MRYLCLVYNEERVLNEMPKAELSAFEARHSDLSDELRKSGNFLESAGLVAERMATIVRIRSGRISVTDGPFAETKEQLGGFYLIEATDLNDAIQIATRIPSAHTGSIEIRPVREDMR
jgi:hypothetical protein